MAPTSIRLHYFNARARAELIRYILLYAEVPFVDNRIDPTLWPKIKPKFPTGQMPVIEYMNEKGDVKLLVQSNTIARTCARWFGLAGRTPVEMAEADETHECMRDIADAAALLTLESNNEKRVRFFLFEKAEALKIESETIPRFLSFLEKKLETNGGKFVAGGKSATYADLSIAVVLDSISRDISFIPSVIYCPAIVDLKILQKQYPGILGIKKQIEEAKPIKTYLATRPNTPF